MIKEAKSAAVWLWGVARNPDVVVEDVETGEQIRERWSRSARFRLLRPAWMRTFATVQAECGCRARYWGTRLLVCKEHAYLFSEEVDE